MGTVYRALHTRLQRLVALKTLAPTRTDNPQALQRFRREMEALGRLDHPNVIRATDASEADGCYFLVMELVEGVDLAQLLRRLGPLGLADACEVARQTAEGLEYIHRRNLVHRDIKPSNLLLAPGGLVKVLDLGLARLMPLDRGLEPMTASGQVMGTADYMAPEQGQGSRCVDIRSDLYSLGCTLYALLAGQPPFATLAHGSFYAKVKAHIEEPIPPLQQLRSDLPPELLPVLSRLLAKEPEQRYQTPAEAARALQPFTRGAALEPLWRQAREALGLSAVNRATEDIPTLLRLTVSEQAGQRSPSGTPTAVQQGRGRVAWGRVARGGAVVLLLLVLLLPVLIGGQVLRGPGTHARILKPGEWYDLLDQPPVVLQAPPGAGNLTLLPDPHDTKQLLLNSKGLCLLQLGQTRARRFQFEATLEQNPWGGGVGIFWGHQPITYQDHPGTRYNQLELLPFKANPDNKLSRLQWACQPYLMPGVRQFTNALTSDTVLTPWLGNHVFSVTVGPDGVEELAWDGQPLPKLLVLPQLPKNVEIPSSQGRLGIYCRGAMLVVRKARLIIVEE